MYFIKVRLRNTFRFKFLTSRGRANRLRIHAARFTDEAAEKALAELRPLNPELEFRKVPVDQSRHF